MVGGLSRLVEAARTDVAAIRARIDAGERVLAAWKSDPTALAQSEASLAAELSTMATTGIVPRFSGVKKPERIRLAQNLLTTMSDREAALGTMAMSWISGAQPYTSESYGRR